jgi:hypothetical protein
MPPPSPAYPPFQPHRNSQSFDSNTAPLPPPKPSSQEVSRNSTPAEYQPLPPPPPPEAFGAQATHQGRLRDVAYAHQIIQDPGEQWLPKILEDKSSVTLRTKTPEID